MGEKYPHPLPEALMGSIDEILPLPRAWKGRWILLLFLILMVYVRCQSLYQLFCSSKQKANCSCEDTPWACEESLYCLERDGAS